MSGNFDASPINIPSTHRRRGDGTADGTGNNLTNLATSLAETFQSWTGNYSFTAR